MATDQKIENMLNLALSATPQEREKSLELDVGFDRTTRTWDVIVKYSGNVSRLEDGEITVQELSNEYAIITLPQSRMEYLANAPEIEYIEKPKRLFFAVNQGRAASCMSALQTAQYDLQGQGILIAVIDSGVDYFHPDFRNQDGTTRIQAIWDQDGSGNPPPGFQRGAEYSRQQINEALLAGSRAAAYQTVPVGDVSGHGTQVLGICAGNGRASNGRYRGVASRCEILVVKLGAAREDGFPRTIELMEGIDYAIRKAAEFSLPLVINLSFGTVYGGHDGTGLLETYISDMANRGRTTIVIGTGNEGSSAGHTSGILQEGQPLTIEFGISANETALNIQLWKHYTDEFLVTLVSPSGQRLGPFQELLGPQRFLTPGTEILVYYGKPSPYSVSQEIYMDFLPVGTYLDSGVWRIILEPRRIVVGRYDLWLPPAGVINPNTRFYQPNPETTLTIPSTAAKVISVAAYDSRLISYASFSGRGFNRIDQVVKPDLAAPGVDITTTAVGGGYTTVSGTSFATPFVSGGAAMMMQWGIVDGNDPFLYGEKVKAYLRRGARQLPGFDVWPNEQLGWGALCVRDSLPV